VSLCRVLRPRQDRRVRRLDVVGTAPAMSTTKAPTISCLSGLNGTALELAVYASCGRLSGQHATLASGCWPALPGGIGYPQGSTKGFSVVSLHRFPLSQALPGARTFIFSRSFVAAKSCRPADFGPAVECNNLLADPFSVPSCRIEFKLSGDAEAADRVDKAECRRVSARLKHLARRRARMLDWVSWSARSKRRTER
jgi:hypothetical protein